MLVRRWLLEIETRLGVGQRHQVCSYTWLARAQSTDARQFGNTLRVHFTQRLGDAKSRLIVAIAKLLHVPHVHRRPLVWSLYLCSFLLFERSDSFRFLNELNSYLQESNTPRNSWPVTWWGVNHSKYPHLAVLARRYLSAPMASIASER